MAVATVKPSTMRTQSGSGGVTVSFYATAAALTWPIPSARSSTAMRLRRK